MKRKKTVKKKVKRTRRTKAVTAIGLERDSLKEENENLKNERAGASMSDLCEFINNLVNKVVPPLVPKESVCGPGKSIDISAAMAKIGYEEWCPTLWPTSAQVEFFRSKMHKGASGYVAVDIRTPLWWPVGHEKVAEPPAAHTSSQYQAPTIQSLTNELSLAASAKKEKLKHFSGIQLSSILYKVALAAQVSGALVHFGGLSGFLFYINFLLSHLFDDPVSVVTETDNSFRVHHQRLRDSGIPATFFTETRKSLHIYATKAREKIKKSK